MKLLSILTILLLVTTAHSQTPENDALFGTFNVRNDAARICLATAGPSGAPWCWSSMAFEWPNGPPGEEDYLNHTSAFGYNVDFVGNKIVPGVVSFSFSTEAKYRNGERGQPGAHMNEHHYNWASPDNSIRIRPLGLTVQYDTGDVGLAIHGQINLFRNFSKGGAEVAILHDDGYFDLTRAPNGVIGFKNNSAGMLWANRAGDNSVNPVRVGERDEVLIGGNQQETVITSAKLIYANPQCGAIPDSDGSSQGNQRVLNSILECMRSSGQLPQNQVSMKQDVPVCVAEPPQRTVSPKTLKKGARKMDIGEPKRILIVEPLELPEPLRQPEPERVEEPEKVPVRHE